MPTNITPHPPQPLGVDGRILRERHLMSSMLMLALAAAQRFNGKLPLFSLVTKSAVHAACLSNPMTPAVVYKLPLHKVSKHILN